MSEDIHNGEGKSSWSFPNLMNRIGLPMIIGMQIWIINQIYDLKTKVAVMDYQNAQATERRIELMRAVEKLIDDRRGNNN